MRLKTTDLYLREEGKKLVQQLQELISRTNQQVNQITDGTVSAFHSARSTVPTSGTWAIGDFVRKSTYAEAGAGGSKYVVIGWCRITNGSANTINVDWVEARVLTGN